MRLDLARVGLLGICIGLAGCGEPPLPPELESEDPRQRFAAIAKLSPLGETGQKRLMRIATRDPNEFLRAEALFALAALESPPKFPLAEFQLLSHALEHGPERNRLATLLYLLRTERDQALEEASSAYAKTKNPWVRQKLRSFASEVLDGKELSKDLDHPNPDLVQFLKDCLQIQEKKRQGVYFEPKLPFRPAAPPPKPKPAPKARTKAPEAGTRRSRRHRPRGRAPAASRPAQDQRKRSSK